MRATRHVTLLTALLAATAIAPAIAPPLAAQQATAPATTGVTRWEALIGCWEPVGGAGPSAVCILPAGPAAVELVTVASGGVAGRERLDATGEPQSSSREKCAGTDRGRWSPDGRRVYLRSEHACDGVQVRETGVIAMPSSNELVDVRGVSIAGGPVEVRVRRYRELTNAAVLPLDLAAEVDAAARPTVRTAARANAAAPVGTRQVIEATREVDADVVEAWLVENGDRVDLDARQLVALDEAGVPGRVIDVMVALAYPERFTIQRETRDPMPRDSGSTARPAGTIAASRYDDERRYCDDNRVFGSRCEEYLGRRYSPYGYSPYGWGSGYGYGYGYGHGGGAPVIVVRPTDGEQGRVVKGKGYTRGRTGDDARESAEPRTTREATRPRDTERTRERAKERSTERREPGNSGGEKRTAKPRNP